jgi:hypothetical protein
MNLPVTLAGISKAVAELNKPHRDEKQIRLAQVLFEWWWGRPAVSEFGARWENCDPHIQAFWMDGAWRAMQG